MSPADGGRPGSGFADRLTPLLAAAGVTPVPTLLFRYQALLGLSAQALVLVGWVLSKKWSREWPYLSVDEVAAGMGCTRRSVQLWKQELVRRGYLRAIPRTVPGVGRRADVWDLTNLFAHLEWLHIREQSQAALDRVRADLPEPSLPFPGLATLPTRSTGRGERPFATGDESSFAPRGEAGFAAGVKRRSLRGVKRGSPEEEPSGRTPTGEAGAKKRPAENPADGERALAQRSAGGDDGTATAADRRARLLRDYPEHAAALSAIEERLRGGTAG